MPNDNDLPDWVSPDVVWFRDYEHKLLEYLEKIHKLMDEKKLPPGSNELFLDMATDLELEEKVEEWIILGDVYPYELYIGYRNHMPKVEKLFKRFETETPEELFKGREYILRSALYWEKMREKWKNQE